jgi:hypothetical protein
MQISRKNIGLLLGGPGTAELLGFNPLRAQNTSKMIMINEDVILELSKYLDILTSLCLAQVSPIDCQVASGD